MAGNGRQWPARAKINLYLHVNGRRADGYHCLDSLIVFASLADTITVEASDDLTLTIDGPFAAGLPVDQTNLVLQAAESLARAAGIQARARIKLHKVLPVAAGLGGGSADAAATLLALRALWQLPIDDATLHTLAARLGADVPVCLTTRPSLIGGVGHEVQWAPLLPRFALLLVNPGQAVSTAAVFKALQNTFPPSRPWQESTGQAAALAQALAQRRNDLEPAARRLAPAIGDVIEAVAALPHCRLARMSGSGATCFGLFDNLAHAEAAAGELAAARADWWVQASAIERLD
ncbi:MAG: 4-(cytidine 5'-diphospho)-2-C-methyl-D-erythritol kinase [Alphaproteobacteria bacterium]|nr:4-(cytidine 5'-diphospho)-2-C-methyl-D-erythritol kinase [Alphaproteobacteria bacterium]